MKFKKLYLDRKKYFKIAINNKNMIKIATKYGKSVYYINLGGA
jgi:hypothetical protein